MIKNNLQPKKKENNESQPSHNSTNYQGYIIPQKTYEFIKGKHDKLGPIDSIWADAEYLDFVDELNKRRLKERYQK